MDRVIAKKIISTKKIALKLADICNQITEAFFKLSFSFKKVARLGLEPRLFCTKSRRVASYTIGHCTKWSAKITIM